MSQFDRPGRQQGDFQQEGYASQNRQQGSQESTRRYQGGFGQDEQRGDDWRSQQRSEERYRENESSGQGNAWQINGPAGQSRYQEEQGSSGYRGEQRRDRAPYESNYGYESSHPSYQARGAGDWSRRSGMNQDFGQGNAGYGGSSGQGSQGSYGSGQDQQEQFDPDYHQWRRDQLQSLDNDYRQFRQERYKKFSDEFSTWRSGRSDQGGQQQGGQQASKQDGQQQSAMSGSGDASKQSKDKDK